MALRTPNRVYAGSAQAAVFEAAEEKLEATGILMRLWREYGVFVVPGTFLLLLAGACFVWPLIYSVPLPVGGAFAGANEFPLSPGHILGTDPLGNDVMSRILYGGRISLEVGIGATSMGMVIGGVLGIVAGYLGRFAQVLIMRTLDVLLAFPSLVLAIIITTYLGPSELHVIFAISFFSIPAFARLARAHTLRIVGQPFISAAAVCGTRRVRIVVRHLVPNVLPSVLTFALLGVTIAVLVEAALSFLGLGVPPPAPSWGNMISQGQPYLSSNPYLIIVPMAFLWATATSLNKLGDALRHRWAS